MRKVLFTAKVDSHIRHFHIPYLKYFKQKGFQVHVASEGNEKSEYCDFKYNLKFGTNPFSKQIVSAYKELYKIMDENEFEIIHTHTAIASVLTRIVAYRVNRKKSKKSKVIYTAHGFHFLKGGSKLSWILFFPVEYILSKITDDLILINQEDFLLAEKYSMGAKRHLISGVGVNLERFSNDYVMRDPNDTFTISYIAEFSKNKNHILLIEAFELALKKYPKLQLKLVGTGKQEDVILNYILLNNLNDSIELTGYRKDVETILKGTDLVVATSLREGLPINIIESMAMGLPLIVTKCRGHVDLVVDGENGVIVDYDKEEIAKEIIKMIQNPSIRLFYSKNNLEKSKKYSIDMVLKKMTEIYNVESE